MKHKNFKWIAAASITGILCTLAVPNLSVANYSNNTLTASAASAGQTLSVGNGRNQYKEDNVDGYSYEIWLDQTGGSGSMTLGSGGSFNTEWSAQVNAGNFLARRGRNYDASKKATQYGNIVLDYAADYSASSQGNSRLCVYGWFKNPLVEYYIIEDWVNWRPTGNSQTVTIDGAEYEIFQLDHTGPTILGTTETFKQYFSVRKQKRTSGTITVSDHFKAWENAGWNIGNLTEVALNVEGWESSGKANVSKLSISAGGESTIAQQPVQQNNDWNQQPAQQNNDWNQNNDWSNWNWNQNNDWNNQQQNNDWNNQWNQNNDWNNQQQNNDWNNQQQNNDWNQWNQNNDWNNQWNQNNDWNNQQQNNDWNQWNQNNDWSNQWNQNNDWNNQQQNNDWNQWNQNNDWNSWNQNNDWNNQQQNNDWNNWNQNNDWNQWNQNNDWNNQQQNNDWNNWNQNNDWNNQQQNNDWNNWNQNNDWNQWNQNNDWNNQQQNNTWNNSVGSANSGQTFSVGNGRNQYKEDNVDGYSYEIWLDQTGGSGSMTLGSGGSFNTEWSAQVNAGNFLARRGRNYDASKKATQYGNIVLDYAADYSASSQGNSRLCVYGWFKNPLVEYYIIEDWVNWRPTGNSQTVIIDGAEYEIFQLDHTGPTILGTTETFKQYFSVRKQKRTSGTITVSDHFKAWENAGWNIGNLTEVALNVEGWESSGKANVSKLTISEGGASSTTVQQPVQQNNDWNQQPVQNNDWNWNQNNDWNNQNQWNQNNDWSSWNFNNDWNNQNQNNDWNNWNVNNDWNNQNQNNDWNNWNQNNDWNNQNQWNQNNDWNNWNQQPAQNNNTAVQPAQTLSGKKLVAISFDDGASATSRQDPAYRIMDALIKNNFHATFFYVGDWIKTNEQVKFAYENGMEVANHTKSHQSLGSLDANTIRSEWEQCNSKLRSIIGTEPSHLMRLPYLDGGGQVKSALYDVPLISCGLDTQDWNGASADQIVNTIKSAAMNGTLENQIVLCHENYASTAQAMETVLPWLKENGYEVVTISDMFAAQGKQLSGGQIYTRA